MNYIKHFEEHHLVFKKKSCQELELTPAVTKTSQKRLNFSQRRLRLV